MKKLLFCLTIGFWVGHFNSFSQTVHHFAINDNTITTGWSLYEVKVLDQLNYTNVGFTGNFTITDYINPDIVKYVQTGGTIYQHIFYNTGQYSLYVHRTDNFFIGYDYLFIVSNHGTAEVNKLASAANQIYPNPATDLLHIAGFIGKDLQIVDLNGAVILETHLLLNQQTIDVSGFTKGVYLFVVDGIVKGRIQKN
jgi:hypothetical protein